jgi:S-adenosylmethionine-dependent methyltransferase
MDRNFDDLCDRLKKKVYGSPKGKLRLELLMEDLEPYVSDTEKPMTVLDAGGGFGPVCLKLAEMGHTIVLCDISENMLEEAKRRFSEAGLTDRLEIFHLPFQELPEQYFNQFDLVLSHAVLEWLENPKPSFFKLKKYSKKNGLLSLMIYNLNSMICQNAIKGNFHKIMKEEFAGDPNGLTPANPLTPSDVLDWCDTAGLEILSKTGIRVFYDLMNRQMQSERSFEDIRALERKYCRIEPFVSMGRYVHLVGRYR